MKDCSICKYCDEDFDFDEETGEVSGLQLSKRE